MTSKATRIAELNDAFRTQQMGQVVLTTSVAALPRATQMRALRVVRDFSDFNNDNDPYGEHDFGMFRIGGVLFYWKIDYYFLGLEWGSDDPADETKTTRVLTIMLAEDYWDDCNRQDARPD